MGKEYQIAVGNYIYIAVKIGDRIKVVKVIKNRKKLNPSCIDKKSSILY